MRKLASSILGAGLCASALLSSAPAEARARGIVSSSCDSCHGSSSAAELSLSSSPSSFEPGARVTFTLGIRSPTIKVGGAYIYAGGVGTLTPSSGEGLVAGSDELLHDSPKAASGGEVSFRFNWQAPAKPGAVTFVVGALAGNGDGRSSGDAPASREFQFVFGCEGREYYRDSDRDGYGTAELPKVLACADNPPDQLALVAGDCDDYNDAWHPDANELCNGKDDDCDGQIDEGLEAVVLWPDADGDGYYASQSGTPKVGCAGLKGYAALGGDCAPNDASIHPGAPEVCNEKDDNCDGRIDERVRPQCGAGWCLRDSRTCRPEDCEPGVPSPEVCNQLDDDCNGIADDGPVCGAGMSCVNGGCQPDGAVGATGGNSTSGGTSAAGANAGGFSAAGGNHSAGSSVEGCGGANCGAAGANPSQGGVATGAGTDDSGAGCGVTPGASRASSWFGALAFAAVLGRAWRRRATARRNEC